MKHRPGWIFFRPRLRRFLSRKEKAGQASALLVAIVHSPFDAIIGKAQGKSVWHVQEEALRENPAKLARELEDAKQLQKISSLLIEDESGARLYEHILDAVIAIMRAEFGSIQMLDTERGELRLLACRNFHPESAVYWQKVSVKSGTPCGSALQHGKRIIVPDVNAADFLQNTEDFRHFRLSGITAVQSTPLTTRGGQLIGMISTHWRQRHEPGERDLALLDVLARQAADVLERRRAQEALRASESWLAGQKEAFETAIHGAPLEESLSVLVRTALKHAGEDVRCAFYIADRARRELRHVTGMSESYGECVDGFKIGPDSLACGLAVYTGQPVITPDVTEAPRWKPWLWLANKYEYRACWSFPIETPAGKAIGTFAMYFKSPREATQKDYEFAALLTRAAAIIISQNQGTEERVRVEAALRRSESKLAMELADTQTLQRLSSSLIQEDNINTLYDEILEAARALMRSDFASIQRLVPERNALLLLAQKGFAPQSAAFWKWVGLDHTSSCGLAMSSGERVVIPDVERWDFVAGTADLAHYRLSGIRAMQSTRLISRTGRLIGMISTHWRDVHQPAERELRLLDLLARQAADVIERRASEEALREMSTELSRTLDTAATGLTHCSRDLRYLSANAAYAKWIGLPREQIVGRPIVDVMGQAAFDVICPQVEKVLQGERVEYEAELLIEGSLKPIHVIYTPDRDAAGAVVGWVGSVTDISERKQREEQVRLLLREVNHRSKNLLTLVQAVARQTVASDPDDFLERFGERVQALAASQDLLVKSGWKGVELGELVRSQLAHFKDLIGSRIELAGPPPAISAPAAQAIGMALHELATNAGKYGALSNGSGRISIAWSIESTDGEKPVFTMIWRERGGPPVKVPARQGYGTAVMCEMTEMSLSAEVGLDFGAAGLTWRLRCPAAAVLDESECARASRSATLPPASISAPARSRPAVLVVEDEPLVAMEVAHVLKRAGFEIVGSARTLAQGLELLRTKGCDAAVLDINLGKETSELVALELKKRGTPFVTLSGYTPAQHPPAFHGVPALGKPLRPEVLVAEIQRCIEQDAHRPAI